VDRARGKAGLLTMLTDPIDDAVLEAAGPELKVISQMAVGFDNIDIHAAQRRGIAVGNTPGVLTEATADIAMALMLALGRRIVEGMAYIRAGQWKTWEPQTLLGIDLAGATLGVIGFGRIGRAFARRAAAFDMRILACSPSLTDADAEAHGVERVEIDDLLRRADVVSLHTSLNAQTRHLLNRDRLALMKPSAILVNTARGAVVDQQALYDALVSGTIAGAALDVTDPEPLPADHPLLALSNVVIAPHVGSATVGTRRRMAVMAAENLIAGVTGQPLPTRVV
jgi:lactate dehydrogenase-like 2-hydroxyacid dehydrogenase